MPRVLVVEDDAVIALLIESQLKAGGVDYDLASSLGAARSLLEKCRYDLVTLDLHLPDGDGLEFCNELKTRPKFDTPIIILTTEASAENVVRGFECGACDYLRKPIDPLELRARLQGHLRAHAENPATLEYGSLALNLEKRELHHKGRKLTLKGKQFDLLAAFLRRPGVVLTREQLIGTLDKDAEIYDRTIDSHVSQLRRKLKDQGVTGIEICSIFGVGYRLE